MENKIIWKICTPRFVYLVLKKKFDLLEIIVGSFERMNIRFKECAKRRAFYNSKLTIY